MTTPTRFITMLVALLLAPALVLAGPVARVAAQELGVRCMNPETGYIVGVPVGWYYNTHVEGEGAAEDVAACRFFSPTDFTVTPGSQPSGIAIFMGQQTGDIDPSAGESTTVDGRDAVRYETSDADSSIYIYEIDLPGDQMLVASTDSAWEGDYAENKAYLDAMMDDLEWVAPSARLGGDDRFATAAAVSSANFDAGQEVVYVATGMKFADALAGTAIAGIDASPILLVLPNAIPSETAAELDRLNPTRVVVLGGPGVVSNAVASQLAAYASSGEVDRLWGDDRYATAAAISESRFSAGVARVYVASGENFPDALAGGALAGRIDGPLLLVQQDRVPAVIAGELSRLDPAAVVVLGGPGAVSNAVAAELATYSGGNIYRLWGDDRYATAAEISRWTFEAGVPAVYITTGVQFPDALASGPAAVVDGGPVLLVRPDSVPNATANELERLAPDRVLVVGGPGAVSEGVRRTVADLARP